MKTMIEVHAEDIKALTQLALDLETDYITNDSREADKRRTNYERLVKSLLDRVRLVETGPKPGLPAGHPDRHLHLP